MLEETKKRIDALIGKIESAWDKLNVNQKIENSAQISNLMQESDFWNDSVEAQKVAKKQAQIENQIKPWIEIREKINEIRELAKLNDSSLAVEIEGQVKILEDEFEKLEYNLLLGGKYDENDAIISIHAGAGGTDAQDWSQMLERMYIRWAEAQKNEVKIIDESPGEEAGIKSATMSISGPYAYGKLKGERGVHRLVRLSPFNADHLRQTSFALVEILPQIEEPDEVKIDEKDLKIDVFRAGGHGGQSVNTTDSAVRITHIPTSINVSIQNERSQLQNKETALKVLRSKLAQLAEEQHKETIAELKGPTKEAAWGNQIRNYVMHPYTLVKDTRIKYEEKDVQKVLNGKIDGFIEAYLRAQIGKD